MSHWPRHYINSQTNSTVDLLTVSLLVKSFPGDHMQFVFDSRNLLAMMW